MEPEWTYEELKQEVPHNVSWNMSEEHITICGLGWAIQLFPDGTYSAGPDGEG